jgi:hypothetical protein
MYRLRMVTTALLLTVMLGTAFVSEAQYGRTKKKADASPGAVSEQTVGIDSKISISYHRPAVKGREIWGTGLAPYGEDKPWRAGANETTAITFSDDVEIGGTKIAAGTYGVHIAIADGDWTWVLNKNYKTWGTYQYKIDDDVVRVKATPEDAPHQERLVYGFSDLTEDGATLFMHWEKKKVSLPIKLAK